MAKQLLWMRPKVSCEYINLIKFFMEFRSSPEFHPLVEIEKSPRPSIRLEFFRHDRKATPTEGQPDETVRLTPEGRVHAAKAGRDQDPHPEVALVYGSPRQRSQETAYRHMLAGEPRITEDLSLEEMQAIIDAELTLQKKMGEGRLKKEIITDHLNFQWDKETSLGAELYEHYEKTKDALVYVWQSSDERARELQDSESTTYSRAAGNIAELIAKHLRMLPNWEKIIAKSPGAYKAYKNELQRFFASHQCVTECFLLKVIEKINGPEAVRTFLEKLPNKNGFDFSEGYTICMEGTEKGEAILAVRFHDEQWSVPASMIREIIEERDELNRSIHQEV